MRVVTVWYSNNNAERFDILRRRNDRYYASGIRIETIEGYYDETYSYPGMVRRYLKGYDGLVAVLDADVWCSVKQLREAGELCLAEKVPMVFPYDGRVSEGIKIKADGQIGLGYVFNWKQYCEECGGENPNMRMWGDDDVERYTRVGRFFKIPRVAGVIEHYAHRPALMEHDFSKSNLAEVDKAKNMTLDELCAYWKTWK